MIKKNKKQMNKKLLLDSMLLKNNTDFLDVTGFCGSGSNSTNYAGWGCTHGGNKCISGGPHVFTGVIS